MAFEKNSRFELFRHERRGLRRYVGVVVQILRHIEEERLEPQTSYKRDKLSSFYLYNEEHGI